MGKQKISKQICNQIIHDAHYLFVGGFIYGLLFRLSGICRDCDGKGGGT
jgi:hypothetical protein